MSNAERRPYEFDKQTKQLIHETYQGRCAVPWCGEESDGIKDHTFPISMARLFQLPKEKVKSIFNGQELCPDHTNFKCWLEYRWYNTLSKMGVNRRKMVRLRRKPV